MICLNLLMFADLNDHFIDFWVNFSEMAGDFWGNQNQNLIFGPIILVVLDANRLLLRRFRFKLCKLSLRLAGRGSSSRGACCGSAAGCASWSVSGWWSAKPEDPWPHPGQRQRQRNATFRCNACSNYKQNF